MQQYRTNVLHCQVVFYGHVNEEMLACPAYVPKFRFVSVDIYAIGMDLCGSGERIISFCVELDQPGTEK